jgi:hypothetical protein
VLSAGRLPFRPFIDTLHVTEVAMTRHEKIDGKTRVARHRAVMRANGYRLKQFWVPDVRTAEFREQARRDAVAIANSAQQANDQAFIDAISDGDTSSPWDGEA